MALGPLSSLHASEGARNESANRDKQQEAFGVYAYIYTYVYIHTSIYINKYNMNNYGDMKVRWIEFRLSSDLGEAWPLM